jgi:cbb3-type cytochrome oxidase cytochrome c subunit
LRIVASLGVVLAVLLTCSHGGARVQEFSGADLAQRLGCFACHSLKGQGGHGAVSLDGVGTRLTPRQVRLAITWPRRLHPHAKMPSYAYLPPAEQEALANYLQKLN